MLKEYECVICGATVLDTEDESDVPRICSVCEADIDEESEFTFWLDVCGCGPDCDISCSCECHKDTK